LGPGKAPDYRFRAHEPERGEEARTNKAGASANASAQEKRARGAHEEKKLTGLDWLVIAGYGLTVLAIGVAVQRGHATAADLLVGRRSIPLWAVLCSMIATELSAATFLGVPDAGYGQSWSYLELAFGALLGKLVLSLYVIPLYHRIGAVSIYELLAQRFGLREQRAAAMCFIGGRILASGVRLFIAALALSVATDASIGLTIAACGVVAGLYTWAGGIRSVIYTDALQAAVFLAAAGALVVGAAGLVDGGVPAILDWGLEQGATRVFVGPPWVSLSDSRPLGTAVVGGFFLTLATHGTDADMVQRLLAARGGRQGGAALLGSALLNFPLTMLFLFVGTAIACVHATVPAAAAAAEAGRVVPAFALAVLPAGLRGLVFAGIAAAAMSSLDSAICAIATTWCIDVAPARGREDLAPRVRRAAGAVTALLIASAIGMAAYHAHVSSIRAGDAAPLSLVELALSAMTILYGGLLGVFAVAVLDRRDGSETAAVAGLAVGAAIGLGLFLHPVLLDRTWLAWTWWIPVAALPAAAVTWLGARARARTTRADDG